MVDIFYSGIEISAYIEAVGITSGLWYYVRAECMYEIKPVLSEWASAEYGNTD